MRDFKRRKVGLPDTTLIKKTSKLKLKPLFRGFFIIQREGILMSNTNNFVPVTEAQAVETKISNSVKISKQLMVSELTKRTEQLLEEYKAADVAAHIRSQAFFMFAREDIARQVRLLVNNDGKLTRFRNLYKDMSLMQDADDREVEWKTNVDIIKMDSIDENLQTIQTEVSTGAAHWVDKEDKEAWVNHKMVTVDVKTIFPDLNFNGHHGMYDNYLGFSLRFEIPDKALEQLDLYVEASKNARALNEQYNAMETKFKNIDKVAEEMEAKLLVQELAKSEEGKAALGIASDLVSEMLGETPVLLGEFKE
ncbi:hypothetical protein VPHK479_0045 [Vibrio phage K479]